MDSAMVNALRKIGQVDCTVHRVTTLVFGLVGVYIFMQSYQGVQAKKTDQITLEKLAFVGSGLCVIFSIISFIVLSTDWGCAFVAIRNASRLL